MTHKEKPQKSTKTKDMDCGLKQQVITTKGDIEIFCSNLFNLAVNVGIVKEYAVRSAINSYSFKSRRIGVKRIKEIIRKQVNNAPDGAVMLKSHLDCIFKCVEVAYKSKSEEEAILKSRNICEIFAEEQKLICLNNIHITNPESDN